MDQDFILAPYLVNVHVDCIIRNLYLHKEQKLELKLLRETSTIADMLLIILLTGYKKKPLFFIY